jgi:hypothetical protein
MNEERITESPSWSDLRGQVMKTPDDVAEMLRLKGCGWGLKRIARQLGCSHHTVRDYVAAAVQFNDKLIAFATQMDSGPPIARPASLAFCGHRNSRHAALVPGSLPLHAQLRRHHRATCHPSRHGNGRHKKIRRSDNEAWTPPGRTVDDTFPNYSTNQVNWIA